MLHVEKLDLLGEGIQKMRKKMSPGLETRLQRRSQTFEGGNREREMKYAGRERERDEEILVHKGECMQARKRSR